MFNSDNGMNMGHHGIWGKGNGTYPPNMFDTSVKVPMLVSRPGPCSPGLGLRQTAQPVRLHAYAARLRRLGGDFRSAACWQGLLSRAERRVDVCRYPRVRPGRVRPDPHDSHTQIGSTSTATRTAQTSCTIWPTIHLKTGTWQTTPNTASTSRRSGPISNPGTTSTSTLEWTDLRTTSPAKARSDSPAQKTTTSPSPTMSSSSTRGCRGIS